MDAKRLIYLASPYSAPTAEARELRFHEALRCTVYLMNRGLIVFSPIAHTHPIAVHHELPKDWAFWKRQDEAMLAKCDELMILTIDGWEQSTGVTAEIRFANSLGLPVSAVVPNGNGYKLAEFIDGMIVLHQNE